MEEDRGPLLLFLLLLHLLSLSLYQSHSLSNGLPRSPLESEVGTEDNWCCKMKERMNRGALVCSLIFEHRFMSQLQTQGRAGIAVLASDPQPEATCELEKRREKI